jgi:predicted transcriptional regulator
MRTVSFKLPAALDQSLDNLARQRHSSKSALVREALERLAKGTRRSVTARAGRLVGSLEAPADLSTHPRHMAGYGR